MRLLVTGAAGFIGRAVTDALARQAGVEAVRLVDRVTPCLPQDARFEACCADLAEPAEALAALEGMDGVIHLASIPGGSAEA
ncbi:MAG TPA: NAD-dependent epimerase/dehydratase family protein, partial [Novosphingobium sp.]|nr:NAD-dependent epimerase/dehydratase family protein [Novosphingobium sp.]